MILLRNMGIKDNFASLVTDRDQLIYAIEYLNKEQTLCLLNAIKPKLADFFADKDNLEHVLKYINKDQQKILLDFMKNYLRDQTMMSNVESQRTLKANLRKVQEKPFQHTVTDNHEMALLNSKLHAYLEEKERSYPFPWLSSSLYASINLFSQETKCGACAYLIDVIEKKRHPYILLEKAESLPHPDILKNEEYKHSYIWVNNKDLYFIDYQGASHLVEVKDAEKLQKAMKDIFKEQNDSRISPNVLNRQIGPHVKTLPTEAQRQALFQGKLGQIIRNSGCIDKILDCFSEEEYYVKNSPKP